MQRLLESGGLQAKLRVGHAGDADEQEADHAAEHAVSAQAAPRLQRKCACGGSCSQCREEQESIIHRHARSHPVLRSFPFSIQRQAATTEEPSHRAAAADADTRRDQAKHPGAHPRTLIVDDDAPSLGPGQMRKREFVALLQTTTCATADAVLESVGHTTKGCPYIKKWLEHYKGQDAAHLTRAMHKYAPETGRARSAHEAIALVNQRVERAALKWAKTGKMTDLSEGIQEETAGGDGFLGAVMGFAHSGFGRALLGFIGGGKKEEKGKSSGASEAGGAQRKSRNGAASGGHDAAAVQEQLGSGQALDGGVQSRMSAAFGYDFSGVRVHADAKAGELSSQLNARAFTIGRDVAFAGGEYQPGTLIGDALIAHELAHVVQQGGGNRSGGPQPKDNSLGDESSLEEEADRSAVGAVVSAWTGPKSGFADVSASGLTRLKSGLKLQRCAHQEQVRAPSGPRPRPAPVDANAQRIIGIAQNAEQPIAQRAVAVVQAIINQYFPSDAAKISRIIYKKAEGGLHTTSSGRGANITGEIEVGDYFVENTTAADFARRVAQVAHEIEHVDQWRSGMVGDNRSDEREFLAFYHESLVQELPGTGRMVHSTRVHLLDSALGYYYCLSNELQQANTTRRDELLARRAEEVRRSHRHDLRAAPTGCERQAD